MFSGQDVIPGRHFLPPVPKLPVIDTPSFSSSFSSSSYHSSSSSFSSGGSGIGPHLTGSELVRLPRVFKESVNRLTTPSSDNVTNDVSPTEATTPDSGTFEVYAIALTVIAVVVMTSSLLYFLCRCWMRRKRRQNQLSTLTPAKTRDPRMLGVRQDQPIQFVVPTTIIINETTEDSFSETDYSSSGMLPMVLSKRRKRDISGFHINPDDLQYGLYVGVKAASEKGTFLGDLGKVGFRLSYNNTRSQLVVNLIGATDLPCLFLKTTANPCAKVVLLPDRTTKYMTKVQKNTMNPVFNETFSFAVRKEDLEIKKMKISVWDYDRFSRKCLIGQILYFLKDSGLGNSSEQEASTGDIWVDLKQETVSRSSGCGELLFSLCYNPDTANLTLTVLKVRGLIMKDGGKDETVYVKITLYVRRKLVRTKKTPAKRKAPELEYSDAFNVHVPSSALSEVDFLVSLCEKAQTLGSKTSVLGRTQVGANCPSEQGAQHWQDMLLSPKSTCAQWHALYGC